MFTITEYGPSCNPGTTTRTTTSTTTTTAAPTTTTTTLSPVYYNIFDCGNSSTGYSIQYAAGTFATNERCTATASGFPTRTVIIIGSTTTEPSAPLYTLTSQSVLGCAATTTTTTLAPTTTTTTSTTTTSTTTTTTAAPTTTTTTPAPVYYNIFDCGNSSTAYSIAYAPGTFATNERCTAVASGFPTRTVIIIGSTTTTPGGPLYTLTSQGVFGCAATTTTTTAAPTTTTTTAATGVAYVEISNNTSGATITGVTVNAVPIDGASFPLTFDDFTSGTTNQIGTSTVIISYSGASGDYVSIFDTDLNYNCANATSSSRAFGGQVIGSAGVVTIDMGDGPCP
jgi:hypothetical protein